MKTVIVAPGQHEGWELKEAGADMPRAHFDTRELAEQAARRAVEVGEADKVEIHDEAEEAEEFAADDPGFRSAAMYFTLMAFAVVALIVLISVFDVAG